MNQGRRIILLTRFAGLYSLLAMTTGAVVGCSSQPDQERTATAHQKLGQGCECGGYYDSSGVGHCDMCPPDPAPDPVPDPPPSGGPGPGGGDPGNPGDAGNGEYGTEANHCQLGPEWTNLEFGTLCSNSSGTMHPMSYNGTRLPLLCIGRDPDGITRPEQYDAAQQCQGYGGVQVCGTGPGIYTPCACCATN